jgi:tripartite-type tricarboxylate transporter receptor subunit TctC
LEEIAMKALLRLVLLSLLLALPAAADEAYPTRPLRLVVPFPAAGPTDIVSRILAGRLSEILGQSIMVDNRGGAGGSIGSEVVAKAAPDGYTILMGTLATHTLNTLMLPNIPYDPVRDFEPIAQVLINPNVLLVNPSLEAQSVQQLIALLKANPGKYAYGSSGNGTPLHLAGELFKMRTGVDMPHVPYRGSGPALNDLMAGQIMIMFETPASSVSFVRAGKIRALAVNSPQRCAALPDVPTMAESGVPDYLTYTWNGLFAPAKTPHAIIDRLNQATVQALADPTVRARLTELGTDVASSTPEALGALVKSELTKWAPIVQASGAKVV